MYSISKKVYFEAAHFLRAYHGKCENLHGHSWVIELTVELTELDNEGMGVDFIWLKKLLQEKVLARFDHQLINEIPPFDKLNPTSENLARHIHESLVADLGKIDRITCYSVTIWESPNSSVTYKP